MPADGFTFAVLIRCQPVYAEFPGWRSPTHKARSWKDLPSKARSYLKAIAELTAFYTREIENIKKLRTDKLLELMKNQVAHEASTPSK